MDTELTPISEVPVKQRKHTPYDKWSPSYMRPELWWNGDKLRRHGTRLNCIEHGLQTVVDWLPLQKVARLQCNCTRGIRATKEKV